MQRAERRSTAPPQQQQQQHQTSATTAAAAYNRGAYAAPTRPTPPPPSSALPASQPARKRFQLSTNTSPSKGAPDGSATPTHAAPLGHSHSLGAVAAPSPYSQPHSFASTLRASPYTTPSAPHSPVAPTAPARALPSSASYPTTTTTSTSTSWQQQRQPVAGANRPFSLPSQPPPHTIESTARSNGTPSPYQTPFQATTPVTSTPLYHASQVTTPAAAPALPSPWSGRPAATASEQAPVVSPAPRPIATSTLAPLGGMQLVCGQQVDCSNTVPAVVEFSICSKNRYCGALSRWCSLINAHQCCARASFIGGNLTRRTRRTRRADSPPTKSPTRPFFVSARPSPTRRSKSLAARSRSNTTIR